MQGQVGKGSHQGAGRWRKGLCRFEMQCKRGGKMSPRSYLQTQVGNLVGQGWGGVVRGAGVHVRLPRPKKKR